MKKAAFYTLGCKVNQYETEAMCELFKNAGYQICEFEEFADGFAHIDEGKVIDGIFRNEGDIQKYHGGPIFVSEYGGFPWIEHVDETAWGYGNMPKTKEEFYEKYEKYTSVLLDNPHIMGFCYTQLYDV